MEPAVMVEPFLVEQVDIGDLDVEEPVAEAPEEPVQEEELPAPPTITSARIYEEQGHLTEALEIYKWLSERDPDYKYLESKVVELENRLERKKAISVNEAQQRRIDTLRRWLGNIEAFKGERNIKDA